MDAKTTKTFISIDLKSFYASVECKERHLDPLTTNLVVADASRTEKTICLAVSPSLKAHGIPGRARLFEVVQRVNEINQERLRNAPQKKFTGASFNDTILNEHPDFKLSYITAAPRMAYYLEYSTRIYDIYSQYVSSDDILVYSIDEVFLDVTSYLNSYHITPHDLALKIILDVWNETEITATAGIGTNMYLCKIAMDIVAKKMPEDQHGFKIASLDELSYRRLLWNHSPLTDFWRIGRGYAKKLEENGLHTMGDIARCSLGEPPDFFCEDLLYNLFGVNAELLIDHAWGWEPANISDALSFTPEANSISSGQVLQEPYPADKARLIVKEMADLLVLELVEKNIVTDQIVLTIGYDVESLTDPSISKKYKGEIVTDFYGRKVPAPAHGTINLSEQTSSSSLILEATMSLYDRIIEKTLLVRRITVAACKILPASEKASAPDYVQMDLFSYNDVPEENPAPPEREKQLQHAILNVQKKFGKNAMLKGMDLEDGATTMQRNNQIGGHKA